MGARRVQRADRDRLLVANRPFCASRYRPTRCSLRARPISRTTTQASRGLATRLRASSSSRPWARRPSSKRRAQARRGRAPHAGLRAPGAGRQPRQAGHAVAAHEPAARRRRSATDPRAPTARSTSSIAERLRAPRATSRASGRSARGSSSGVRCGPSSPGKPGDSTASASQTTSSTGGQDPRPAALDRQAPAGPQPHRLGVDPVLLLEDPRRRATLPCRRRGPAPRPGARSDRDRTPRRRSARCSR